MGGRAADGNEWQYRAAADDEWHSSRQTQSPPFAKGGLGGFAPHAASPERRKPSIIPPIPTVILAQAGIQNPGIRRAPVKPGAWIPAFAGMTVGAGITGGDGNDGG